jgi:DNA-binding MarR family transcriptional regulator
MSLTRRQEEFIRNLLNLHEQVDGPIHYSTLAERLGVSPFTAYDMLCLLEEKGYVISEYQLSSDKSGPGRAERVFIPTESAKKREQRIAEQAGDASLEGEALKEHILEKLRKGEIFDQELADEMLGRIPSAGEGAVLYCVEVMTIVSLRLRESSGGETFQEYFAEILPAEGENCRTKLTMLGGFAFGLLAQDCSSDQEWVQKLFEHVQHYQDIVIKLDPRACRELAEYLATVFKPFNPE